jgi:hypothetical protein
MISVGHKYWRTKIRELFLNGSIILNTELNTSSTALLLSLPLPVFNVQTSLTMLLFVSFVKCSFRWSNIFTYNILFLFDDFRKRPADFYW